MTAQRKWVLISSVLGFLGVALGAFGAHGLKTIISTEMLEVYKTGILYQLIHSVVMLAIALSGDEKYINSEKYFLFGIILFSFSLYTYSVTSVKVFAMITPLGGVLLLVGWIVLIVNAVRR